MASALVFGTVGLLALTALAFWPTYLSKPFQAIDPYTHGHAVVGLLWLLLLAVQALLILGHQRAAHRACGRLSYVLAPAFVLSAVLLAHQRFSRMEASTFEREAYTLYLPLSAAVLFAAAYALALRYRRNAPLHARFMACTALLLVDPVVGRFLAFHVVELPAFWHYQVLTFGLEGALLLMLGRSIPSSHPAHSAFFTFAAIFALVQALWFVAPHTAAWLAWARWFRALPIT